MTKKNNENPEHVSWRVRDAWLVIPPCNYKDRPYCHVDCPYHYECYPNIITMMTRRNAAKFRRDSSTAVGFPKQISQTTHPQSVFRDFSSHTRAHGRTKHDSPLNYQSIMKVTDLNELQQAVQQFMSENPIAIREVMRYVDVESWFITTYTQLNAVKEVTLRFQGYDLTDITIITTMRRLTIMDNQTESMSYAKTDTDIVLYDDLLQDLANLNNYLNMVYLRLILR